MLLGTARILSESRSSLKGTVKLIFQPSEEAGTGAPAMIKDGVLETPPLDGIIGLHTGNLWKGFRSGQIGYRFGALMAGADWFKITFEGKGGHGATPHLAVDPIAMACQAVSAIQMIVSREVSPLASAVVTVGQITGGTAPNIIAPACVIGGTLRSLDPETRALLKERIKAICEDVAHAMRGHAVVEFTYGPPPLINNKVMTEKVKQVAVDLLGKDAVLEVPEPTMGGEDMAFFMEKVPGTFFFHPSGFGEGKDNPHHHPGFDINEDVLWVGSAVMSHFALTWQ
ncbi:MAG: M20 family metallopeptidase [Thermovirgaceae bacterium]|nr:M20 family metallopeptidase [Thermovirgaceae bacterium]